MSIRMLTRKGTIVQLGTQKAAERMKRTHGFTYLDEPESPVETTTEPVTPKRRGRPPKQKETNG